MKTTRNYKQKMLTHSVLVIGCLSAILGLSGCQDEGPAEKAGKKIDSAVEKTSQNIEQVTEKAETKIEAAKESMAQTANEAKDTIKESTDSSKAVLEQAGKQMDQAAEKVGKEIKGAKESIIDKAETTGEYIDDSVITLTVKTAILNDPMLNASHIEVATVNGEVKLSGTVDSEQSIGRSVEVAGSQKHVKSVQADLTVGASAPRQ